MSLFLGLTSEEINTSVDKLSKLLTTTYALYTKTQSYHWDVKGKCFTMLHSLFEKQYQELAEAVDEIAERIRMLNSHSTVNFHNFSQFNHLSEKEDNADVEMLKMLLADHEDIILQLREAIKLLKNYSDEATVDLFIKRLSFHEKTAWILRSHANKGNK